MYACSLFILSFSPHPLLITSIFDLSHLLNSLVRNHIQFNSSTICPSGIYSALISYIFCINLASSGNGICIVFQGEMDLFM